MWHWLRSLSFPKITVIYIATLVAYYFIPPELGILQTIAGWITLFMLGMASWSLYWAVKRWIHKSGYASYQARPRQIRRVRRY